MKRSAPDDPSLLHPVKRMMAAPGRPGMPMMNMPSAMLGGHPPRLQPFGGFAPQIPGLPLHAGLGVPPVLAPSQYPPPQMVPAAPPTNQFAQFPPPKPGAPPPPMMPGVQLTPIPTPLAFQPPPNLPVPVQPPTGMDAPPGFYEGDNVYGGDSRDDDSSRKKKKKKKKKKRDREEKRRSSNESSNPQFAQYSQQQSQYQVVNGVPQLMMMPVMLPTTSTKAKKKKITKTRPRAADPIHLRTCAGETWVDKSLTEWPENDFRIFCGDLGNEVSDAMLTSAFSKYPSFAKAKVIRDKRNGKSRGYGFISFTEPQDFLRALKEMQGKYVGNRPVKLKKSKWKDRIKHVKNFLPGLRPNKSLKRYNLPGPV